MGGLGRWLKRTLTNLHVRMYQMSGGAIGGRVAKVPVMLLETRGRKTGLTRTTPLLFLVDGDKLVVVASNGGAARHPAWYLNLQKTPEASAQIRRDRRPVRARDATPEERARYWPRLVAMYKWYDRYQQKTSRHIPVVVLERA